MSLHGILILMYQKNRRNRTVIGMDAKIAQTKIYGDAAITVADIIGTETIYP